MGDRGGVVYHVWGEGVVCVSRSRFEGHRGSKRLVDVFKVLLLLPRRRPLNTVTMGPRRGHCHCRRGGGADESRRLVNLRGLLRGYL